MDDSAKTALTFVASQLVFVTAVLHVAVGLVEWYRRIQYGVLVPFDLRWPLFVVSGVAVIAGMTVAWRAERKRPWYLVGFVVMLAFVFGYFAWHLGGHRQFIFFGPGPGSHEITLQFLIDHYFAGAFETVSLTIELLAAALLAVLYVTTDE